MYVKAISTVWRSDDGLKTKRDDYLIMPIKTDLKPRNLCENDLGQGFGFILNTVEPQYN